MTTVEEFLNALSSPLNFLAQAPPEAAAVAQLEAWGRRIGVSVVKGKDGADPASVAFESQRKPSMMPTTGLRL